MASSETSLPYHESSVTIILILASFLLLSNFVKWGLDRLVYCGLIGQILIGVAWGTPGGRWLDESVETTIVQLGYLGLILLVYEGGLSTSFQALKANILLSVAVAITGISAPIGLSFTLGGIANATPLQCFAAGAALCSTSLGTTFTMLGTTGLLKTRVGVVLTSAALLDDVVGLVMVQVINNLGTSTSAFSAVAIIRPVFVSVAFAVMCPLLCWLVLKPVALKLNEWRENKREGLLHRTLCRDEVALILHTALLVGMVAGSSYAGTSNLFAAFLTGAIISWWDTELPHLTPSVVQSQEQDQKASPGTLKESPAAIADGLGLSQSGVTIYEKYYMAANTKVLKPFFFTSIGFSIPVSRMFSGHIVWRGVIYSALMLIAKLLCGAWLVRHSVSMPHLRVLRKAITAIMPTYIPHLWGRQRSPAHAEPHAKGQRIGQDISAAPITPYDAGRSQSTTPAKSNDTVTGPCAEPPPQQQDRHNADTGAVSRNVVPASKPFSLYPCAILGLAMVARGEIGFLISSLAESNDILLIGGNDQIFLIVTWAIVLCTVVGPVGVGLLVRRVKRLEQVREGTSGRDVLGVWGVS